MIYSCIMRKKENNEKKNHFETQVSRSNLVRNEQWSTESATSTTTAADAATTVGHYQYLFLVECKKVSSDDEDSLVSVLLLVAHKRPPLNACPLGFEHEWSVKCAQPHAVTFRFGIS